MIIKKIKLENIRSYVNQEINFPEGRLLLSGDIGSGKSTILLAIDFALFGLAKGQNNGAALLRNGMDKGSVELTFDVDNKEVIVRRTLKRGSGITQDSGSITINNNERELTVIELKQAILELLNYPKELLTKSKSLIYKYTVYTPQEEMKGILTEGNDVRLDTLRKVFGIDKYKRIKDNAKIMIDEIKGRKKEYSGQTIDLESKKQEKKELDARLDSAKQEAESIGRELHKVNSEIMYKKEWLDKLMSDVRKHNEIIGNIAVNKVRMENTKRRLEEAREEHTALDNELINLNARFQHINLDINREELAKYNDEIVDLGTRFNDVHLKMGEMNSIINNANDNMLRINQLAICPFCNQQVGDEHKWSVKEEARKKVNEASSQLDKYRDEKRELEEKITGTRKNIETVNIMITEHMHVQKRLDEKKLSKERNAGIIKDAEEEISRLGVEESMLKDSLSGFLDAEKAYQIEREVYDVLLESQRKFIARHSSLNADNNMLAGMLTRLNEEITGKEKLLAKIERIDSVRSWLEDEFIGMIAAMERSVMLRIYSEFDSMFRKWADMLLADGNVRLKLNEEFSPRIEQNGHDIEYEYLSGGEKTAVALAYRLALNQVINSIVSQIRTKDIIILDEPTDGFSDEQLDRMRDVLDELR